MRAPLVRRAGRLSEIWRYYGVGIVNTIFGLSLFSMLIWTGMNLYLAQILAHLTGMAFNYVMFSAHVFHGQRGHVGRYIGAYAINYGVGVALLAVFAQWTANPYVAGLLAAIGASLINYTLLKRFVFRATA